MNNEPMKPYDPDHPDMPPLTDDIPMTEESRRHFNAKAEELQRCRADQAADQKQ